MTHAGEAAEILKIAECKVREIVRWDAAGSPRGARDDRIGAAVFMIVGFRCPCPIGHAVAELRDVVGDVAHDLLFASAVAAEGAADSQRAIGRHVIGKVIFEAGLFIRVDDLHLLQLQLLLLIAGLEREARLLIDAQIDGVHGVRLMVIAGGAGDRLARVRTVDRQIELDALAVGRAAFFVGDLHRPDLRAPIGALQLGDDRHCPAIHHPAASGADLGKHLHGQQRERQDQCQQQAQ